MGYPIFGYRRVESRVRNSKNQCQLIRGAIDSQMVAIDFNSLSPEINFCLFWTEVKGRACELE